MAEDIEPREADEDDLVDRAIAHGDEHVIKFTEACLQRYALGPFAGLPCRRRPRARHDTAPLTRLASLAALRSR